MTSKEIMAIINRLQARKDRQSAALAITIPEIEFWEDELKKLANIPKK